jgi:hypothetical protein
MVFIAVFIVDMTINEHEKTGLTSSGMEGDE